MDSPKTVTMKDVAREAGLSRSAVSLALRKDPSIPETTRQRVEAAARKVGYRPNPLISTLMANLRGTEHASRKYAATLAFLDLNTPDEPPIRAILHQKYFEGAKQRAAELGFVLERFTLEDPDMPPDRIRRILRNRGIRGMVIAPLKEVGEDFPFSLQHFAAVSLSHTTKEALHRCTPHHYANMKLALNHLRGKGFRRIGFCSSRFWDQRVRGLYAAAYLHSQQVEKAIRKMPICFFSQEDFAHDFAAWYERHRPEAIISGVGPPFFDTFARMGLRVPEDVAFVSLTKAGEHADCAGVDEGSEILGSMAVDSVTAQLHRNERGIPGTPKTILYEGVWCDGPTLGDA